MRIGILADIHESTERLREALRVLRAESADAYVVLGDTGDTCDGIDATAALLREVGAVGVWGNHDFGLCRDVDPEIAARVSPLTLAFMATLRPRLVLGGCLFTHVEPWLDAEDPAELWWFDGVPVTPKRLARSFDAAPHERMFIGHFHRWLAATPAGVLPWEGEAPQRFAPGERYLVVVGAVCEGRFALLDTAADLLTPLTLP